MIRVAVLGATGSIGSSTLDVLERNPGQLEAFALAAGRNAEAMREACRRHRPRYAVMQDETAAEELAGYLAADGLTEEIAVRAGDAAVAEVAAHPEVDRVVAGIVGAAGLRSALAAARAGKTLLLANKECLVMAGSLFMAEVEAGGATVIPVDSEHNAVFQVMPAGAGPEDTGGSGVTRVHLTASGGPFRERDPATLARVTPEEAVAHPNWGMGQKISVDSATMMNKGLEVIEAHWLFGVAPAAIEVIVHPESIVHSLVEYRDGSFLAQLGNPDMRTPIAHALAHPGRIPSGVAPLDLPAIGALHFQAPDSQRFPALPLAYRALEAGGTAPAVLNAANEEAVYAFLEGRLDFLGIVRALEAVLGETTVHPATNLEAIWAADTEARQRVRERTPARPDPS